MKRNVQKLAENWPDTSLFFFVEVKHGKKGPTHTVQSLPKMHKAPEQKRVEHQNKTKNELESLHISAALNLE